jgi:hypothetical protein
MMTLSLHKSLHLLERIFRGGAEGRHLVGREEIRGRFRSLGKELKMAWVEATVTVVRRVKATLTLVRRVEATLTLVRRVKATLTLVRRVEATLTLVRRVKATLTLVRRYLRGAAVIRMHVPHLHSHVV